MRNLRVFVTRIAGLFRKPERDRELAEEIESNLQMHIADNVLAGMTHDEARRQALIRLGGINQTKEAYREQRGLPLFDTLVQDVRYALRGLRRTPGFALTAVLTLALGIGATTAIFSVVYALLIRPLPYHDPGRLVWVIEHWPQASGAGAIFEPDMVAWRERNRPFEAVAGYGFDEHTLSGVGETVRIPGVMVSANFLSLLGVTPQLGRDFIPDDHHPTSVPVALISDALWREKFRGGPGVVGSAIDLDGHAYTIIGVLPPRFRFPEMSVAPQVLLTLRTPGSSVFDLSKPVVSLQVIARMRRKQMPAAVQQELQSIQEGRLREYPVRLARTLTGRWIEVTPLQRHLAGDSRTPLLILLVAVGFVLLIACANIANLQLVRAAARQHEIAVRGALGASRSRLARQLLTESVVISAFAAAAGLAVGAFAISAIRGWESTALPWLNSVSLDLYVFAVTLGIALAAALLFGAAPAITAWCSNLIDGLKATSMRMSGVRGHRLLRNSFAVGEVAMALVLLIAAGLLLGSFHNLMHTDPGYDPHNVLTAKVQMVLPNATMTDPNNYRHVLTLASDVVPKLKALPGVRYAALAEVLPLQPYRRFTLAWLGPRLCPECSGSAPPSPATMAKYSVPMISVTADFFRATGTPIVQGRAFTDADNENSPGVAIVNQALARTLADGDALDKRVHSMFVLHCADCPPDNPSELQVVGIAADVRHRGLDRAAEPELYVPFAQAAPMGFNMVLSTNSSPAVLAAPLRATVHAIDNQVPVYDIATMEQRLSESLAQRRLTMFLISAFATLALLLAAIGVYGVISYAVVQRTQEIGIRLALGATRGSVLRLILKHQARLILLGSAAGLALAAGLSDTMSSLLYGVKPRDFATFALSWTVLTAIALLASATPALRATRTDPCVTLRYE